MGDSPDRQTITLAALAGELQATTVHFFEDLVNPAWVTARHPTEDELREGGVGVQSPDRWVTVEIMAAGRDWAPIIERIGKVFNVLGKSGDDTFACVVPISITGQPHFAGKDLPQTFTLKLIMA